jgi:hypothetical protein
MPHDRSTSHSLGNGTDEPEEYANAATARIIYIATKKTIHFIERLFTCFPDVTSIIPQKMACLINLNTEIKTKFGTILMFKNDMKKK